MCARCNQPVAAACTAFAVRGGPAQRAAASRTPRVSPSMSRMPAVKASAARISLAGGTSTSAAAGLRKTRRPFGAAPAAGSTEPSQSATSNPRDGGPKRDLNAEAVSLMPGLRMCTRRPPVNTPRGGQGRRATPRTEGRTTPATFRMDSRWTSSRWKPISAMAPAVSRVRWQLPASTAPGWLEQALPAEPARTSLGGDVLQKEEPATWFEDAPHLSQGAAGGVHRAQHQGTDDDVEGLVRKGKGLGRGVDDGDVGLRPQLALEARPHARVRLGEDESADGWGVVGEVDAGASANLQDVPLGDGQQRPPPVAETGRLCAGQAPVVHPGAERSPHGEREPNPFHGALAPKDARKATTRAQLSL